MMTPALDSLARQLAAHPRWRWLPGMCWIQCPPGDPEEWTDRGRLDGYNPEHMARPVDAIPDLSDPVTAAALLPLAREVSGWPTAVACSWRGVAWAVWPHSEAYAAWCEHGGDADVLSGMSGRMWTEYASEIESLASVILRGGE